MSDTRSAGIDTATEGVASKSRLKRLAAQVPEVVELLEATRSLFPAGGVPDAQLRYIIREEVARLLAGVVQPEGLVAGAWAGEMLPLLRDLVMERRKAEGR